jgi:hypothetical protein
VPELVWHDASRDADGSDNVGEVRSELLEKSLFVAGAGQKPAIEREGIERTEEA